MEFKGTKEKWYKYRRTDNHKVSEIKTIDGINICAINANIEESESNSTLIASAPEMFEMLKKVLNKEDLDIEDYFDIEELLTKITQ